MPVGATLSAGTLVSGDEGEDILFGGDGEGGAVGESQTDSFTYEVSDGQGGTDTATVTVTITGSNDGPVATGGTISGSEDAGSLTGNLVASDVDATDTLSFSLGTGAGDAPQFGSVTIATDGSYSYAPSPAMQGLAVGESQTDSFTYEVSDGQGGTDTATVTVTITGSNDGPVATGGTISGSEDAGSLTGNLVASDVDATDTLSFSLGTGAGDAPQFGSVTIATDGSYSYAPSPAMQGLAVGESQTDSFTYEVSDGQGGTDTATVTVTITGSNDGPVATGGTISGSEDAGSLTGNLVASDVDATDTLSFSLGTGAGDAPQFGSVTIATDGSYSYAPSPAMQGLAVGESQTDSFTYEVSDGQGGMDTATVTVTITGSNDGPVATGGTISGSEDAGSLTGNLVASDVDATDTLSFSLGTGAGDAPQFGSVTIATDGSYSYAPSPAMQGLAVGESQTDSFTYEVSDGQGGTDTATVTVTITGSNDGPVATGGTISGSEDAGSLTGNLVASDVDATDTLSFSLGTGAGDAPQFGSVTIATDGSYSYAPSPAMQGLAVGESQTDSFTYEVSDGQGRHGYGDGDGDDHRLERRAGGRGR